MADLIGICGQVRGLAPKLLSSGQIDRMVGASDASEAFRILVELQYADYIDQDTELSDFDSIITQGLYETRQLLASGGSDHPGLDFLWMEFDVNNLKRALKSKLIEGNTELKSFNDDGSYSLMGNLSAANVNSLVFDGKPSGPLPYQVLEAVNQAATTFAKNNEFRDVEFALDKAYFEHLNAVADELQDDFISDFFTFLVNLTQARNVARSVLTLGEAIPERGFVPFGHFSYDRVSKITTYEELAKAMRATELAPALADVNESDSNAEKMLKIEQGLDTAYHNFLNNAATGSLDSPAVLIDYFAQRLRNARVLKLVMYGKLNGVSSDKIYKLIQTA